MQFIPPGRRKDAELLRFQKNSMRLRLKELKERGTSPQEMMAARRYFRQELDRATNRFEQKYGSGNPLAKKRPPVRGRVKRPKTREPLEPLKERTYNR